MTGIKGQLGRRESSGKTHKGDQLVEKGKEEADVGKVEHNPPVGEVARFVDLVVEDHDAHGKQSCQSQASEDDENVLGNEPPGRMACAEEGGLSRLSSQQSKLMFPSGRDLRGLASHQGLEARWRLGEEELSPW
jgi:hypothetical protein